MIDWITPLDLGDAGLAGIVVLLWRIDSRFKALEFTVKTLWREVYGEGKAKVF